MDRILCRSQEICQPTLIEFIRYVFKLCYLLVDTASKEIQVRLQIDTIVKLFVTHGHATQMRFCNLEKNNSYVTTIIYHINHFIFKYYKSYLWEIKLKLKINWLIYSKELIKINSNLIQVSCDSCRHSILSKYIYIIFIFFIYFYFFHNF